MKIFNKPVDWRSGDSRRKVTEEVDTGLVRN